MNISQKIEEIRKQPEHIRLRYVWGSITVCMIILISVWIFSIGSLFQGDKNSTSANQGANGGEDIAKQLQNLKQQAPSLKDLSATSLDIKNEGAAPQKKATDFQYPADSTVSNVPSETIPEEQTLRPIQ